MTDNPNNQPDPDYYLSPQFRFPFLQQRQDRGNALARITAPARQQAAADYRRNLVMQFKLTFGQDTPRAFFQEDARQAATNGMALAAFTGSAILRNWYPSMVHNVRAQTDARTFVAGFDFAEGVYLSIGEVVETSNALHGRDISAEELRAAQLIQQEHMLKPAGANEQQQQHRRERYTQRLLTDITGQRLFELILEEVVQAQGSPQREPSIMPQWATPELFIGGIEAGKDIYTYFQEDIIQGIPFQT